MYCLTTCLPFLDRTVHPCFHFIVNYTFRNSYWMFEIVISMINAILFSNLQGFGVLILAPF